MTLSVTVKLDSKVPCAIQILKALVLPELAKGSLLVLSLCLYRERESPLLQGDQEVSLVDPFLKPGLDRLAILYVQKFPSTPHELEGSSGSFKPQSHHSAL